MEGLPLVRVLGWRRVSAVLVIVAALLSMFAFARRVEAQWPGDDRLNPHPAEYYTVYCQNDLVSVHLADGRVLKYIPIPSILELSRSGGSIGVGFGMTVTRSDDTITISGSNGNFFGGGHKSFSLTRCLELNGVLLAYYTPRPSAPAYEPAIPASAPSWSQPVSLPVFTGVTGQWHIVQRGENLYRIGLRYGVSYWAIAWANGISNVNHIYAGQVLRIP